MLDFQAPSLEKVQQLISEDDTFRVIWSEVQAKMQGDPGHDSAHVLRVAVWTLRFGEGKLSPRLVIPAALLHDIVNVPKNSPDRARASELSAEYARGLLSRLGYVPEDLDAIGVAIRQHSFSRGEKPETLLARALQDADRIEALGAIGTLRAVAIGVAMGGGLFESQDPWAERRPLDDRRFAIDHFFTKLLKLPGLMATTAGRAEADRRARLMRDFLVQLGVELGHPFSQPDSESWR